MRICFFTSSSGGGGAERILSYLSLELAKLEHSVVHLCVNNVAGYYFQDNAIQYDVLFGEEYDGLSDFGKKIGTFFRLRNYFKRNHFDVIVIFDAVTCVKYYFATLGLDKTAIVVMSERNDPNRYYAKGLKKLWRKLAYDSADKMIFQTNGAMNYFSPRIRVKGVVIPNPINCEYLPERYVGSRRKVIVGIGRLASQKNWPMLIKAFSKLVREHEEYSLEIYGQGSRQKELMMLAERLKISEKVKFLGFVQNVHEKVYDCTMYVSSSNYEGISNAMLEAMALGMPVVCTDCPSGGARQTIMDGVDGLLIPVGDVDTLYLAMKRVIEEPGLAGRLGSGAYKIRERYPIDLIVKRWIDVMVKGFEKKG